MSVTETWGIGAPLKRKEDPKLLTGEGKYVDDIHAPGELWMGMVRSTVAHARIVGIDASAALAMPGVHAVHTGADLDPDRLFAGQHRRRVPLPTYPFEHHRYWVDADVANNGKPSLRATLRKRHDVSTWFSTPSWQRSAAPSAPFPKRCSKPSCWLSCCSSPSSATCARRWSSR